MEGTRCAGPVEYVFVAGAAVFVLTYVLISARKVGVLKIERPAAAMLGAALMILLGVVGPLGAIASINVDVIVLLLGMMLLVAGLDACGFFDAVSEFIARRARTQVQLLAALMVTAAVLSATAVVAALP
jgi:Na+/H+ antiporter NhaD/arsenite permease-like protein